MTARPPHPVVVASRVERHGDVERLLMSRTIAGRPLYWTSVYRLGDVLVDSGCSSARGAFVPWLRQRAPAVVLTTHEHEDHIGNHAAVAPGTRVVAPKLAVEFLENGHPPFPLYRRAVWGYHERAPGAERVGAKVDAAERPFRVVQVNGHSTDHVAYLDERENALFSGDAYMGKFKAARLEEDVHTEIASLRRMADLDPAILFPAHGPVIPRPRARLLDTIDHFERLAKRAWDLADRGLAPRRIAREILGPEPTMAWISMGEFSCEKMVRNLLRSRPS